MPAMPIACRRSPRCRRRRSAARTAPIGGGSVGRNRANCLGCGSPFDGKGTSPVTAFAKNPYHLLDAVGNVWVWTTDCAESGCDERRLIGGSWSNPPADLRVTKTIWNGTAIPFATYGIRVLREAD